MDVAPLPVLSRVYPFLSYPPPALIVHCIDVVAVSAMAVPVFSVLLLAPPPL